MGSCQRQKQGVVFVCVCWCALCVFPMCIGMCLAHLRVEHILLQYAHTHIYTHPPTHPLTHLLTQTHTHNISPLHTQEYGRLLYGLMAQNRGVLKGIVSAETVLGTQLVLHHALVWITCILKNLDAEVSGFVTVKLMYTNAAFTKHSDMTETLWKQLRSEDIPLQPLLPFVGSKLSRSAVSLLSLKIIHQEPLVTVCLSKTCNIEYCVSARVPQHAGAVPLRKKKKAAHEEGMSLAGGEGGASSAANHLGNVYTELELASADKEVGLESAADKLGALNMLGLGGEGELGEVAEGLWLEGQGGEGIGLGGIGEEHGWGSVGEELGFNGDMAQQASGVGEIAFEHTLGAVVEGQKESSGAPAQVLQ